MSLIVASVAGVCAGIALAVASTPSTWAAGAFGALVAYLVSRPFSYVVKKRLREATGKIRPIPVDSFVDRFSRRIEFGTDDDRTVDRAQLIAALAHSGSRSRTAARWLGELRAQEAAPALRRLLAADDPAHRKNAALALGSIEDRGAVQELLTIGRDDPVGNVRGAALFSLGLLHDRGATAGIEAIMQSSSDAMIRSNAAFALGLLDDPSVLEAVRTARRKDRRWSLRYAMLDRLVYRDAIERLKHAQRAERRERGT